jgi:hypothetical protein
MRKFALIAPALLAACSTAPAATPIHGETPGHTCRLAGTEQFIGKAGTSATGGAIKRASHAAVLRWAPPGYMLTMDFRADRVTVYLGPDNKITKINCG